MPPLARLATTRGIALLARALPLLLPHALLVLAGSFARFVLAIPALIAVTISGMSTMLLFVLVVLLVLAVLPGLVLAVFLLVAGDASRRCSLGGWFTPVGSSVPGWVIGPPGKIRTVSLHGIDIVLGVT